MREERKVRRTRDIQVWKDGKKQKQKEKISNIENLHVEYFLLVICLHSSPVLHNNYSLEDVSSGCSLIACFCMCVLGWVGSGQVGSGRRSDKCDDVCGQHHLVAWWCVSYALVRRVWGL